MFWWFNLYILSNSVILNCLNRCISHYLYYIFFLVGKLMELHGEGGGSGKPSGDEAGTKVERADGYEPPVQESV